MKCWKQLVLVFSLLASASLVLSQISVTSLRGTVTDPSGAVVAGAQVVVDDKASGFHQSRVTGSDGGYDFPQLPPGKYTVTVTSAGLGDQSKEAELLVNQPATINFALSMQKSETTVEVSAEAQTLNTTDATIGNAVSNTTIQALPMEGRNVPDLLSLQPGVVYLGRQVNQDVDSRSGAVAGARSDQSNVTLDGVDNNDQRQGYAFTGILRSTLDSVEEFRVTTTNSNADSGRSSGAQVVLVTKSGTNTLHGSVYEYNRNTLFAANDWFNKQAEVSSGLPNKPGELIRNTYGSSLGGPIKKNKLFFFLNYEGQRTAENQQQNLTVPTALFRQGTLQYQAANGSVVTLTPADLATMDPVCQPANEACPGQGANPAVLTALQAYPLPNSSGGDGLNTGGFTWSAPSPTTLNTYIAKVDYVLNTDNRLFVRGNLLGDKIAGAPQFPGNPSNAKQVNISKGVAVGETWTISNNLINNFRYGYIRQGLGNVGAGNNSFSDFVGMSPLTGENTSTFLDVPVHNFIDDLTWSKGKHTLQFGVNYRLIHNNALSNAVSFDSATTGPNNISQAAISGTGQSFDPGAFGFPVVAGSFSTSYDNAVTAVAGLLSTISVHNNYRVASNTSATLLPTGTIIPRDFKANEFEYYLQDSWRVARNLTITVGMRQTLLQAPYEVNGQQVAPSIDLRTWFVNRAIAAAKGLGNQPEFSLAPSGQARGGQPYWAMNKANVAPRLAIAYSPNADSGIMHILFGGPGKSSIRVGAGIYYDHFGQGIVDGFSQFGSFGLSSIQSAPANIFTPDNAPRYTGRNNVPSNALTPAPSSVTYPALPPDNPLTNGFTSTDGINSRIKTPYSVVSDFSVQRQLPGRWVFEADYIGRFGRHMLQQIDYAAATDLVDPKSGMDYYTAAGMMSRFALAHGEDPNAVIAPIPYFEDLFPTAAGGGSSATQNIYTGTSTPVKSAGTSNSTYRWANRPGREVGAPFRLGLLCTDLANGGFSPGCNGTPVPFWDPQFNSLFSWDSIGSSNYNAGQFLLRHPISHGLQIDFSYTYSKSNDMGSDAERTNPQGTTSTTTSTSTGTTNSLIANSWDPGRNYAPSDFDTRHVITATWVYELPVGKAKAFAGHANGLLDAIIGGWQLSGLTRWTSAFPFSIIDSRGFTTSFFFQSYMTQTAPIQTGLFLKDGVPNAFPDPAAVVAGVETNPGVPATLTPLRFPYPGEAGSRNALRAQGYFGVDSGLIKSWNIHERLALKFAWEVFNVTNAVRFDTNTFATPAFDNGSDNSSLGLYRRTLTAPRVQEFSLRVSF